MNAAAPPIAAAAARAGRGLDLMPSDLYGLRAPRSLYIHFPFCSRRCHYCDFSLVRAVRVPWPEWLAALEGEIELWMAATGWGTPVDLATIYVGGGTPSLLRGEGLEALCGVLRRHFRWDPRTVEWTAEANPGSFDREVADRWRAVGVNRVSLGIQSFENEALRWLGRQHDGAGARTAVEVARASGFDNLNVDLMFGLPTDVKRNWSMEVRQAVALGVSHVSTYGLTVEPRTALGRRVQLGRAWVADEARYAAEYLEAVERLGEAGFTHYEVSNFARPGYEAQHNWHYWDGSGYLAVGPSAHSFLPPYRVWNLYRWDHYRTATRAGRPRVEGYERPGPAQSRLERLWLGLRTRSGVPRLELADGSCASVERLLAEWTNNDWVIKDARRVRLTPRGWLLLDRLVVELDQARDSGELLDREEWTWKAAPARTM